MDSSAAGSCFKCEINYFGSSGARRTMTVKTLPCQTVLKSRSGTVHPTLGGFSEKCFIQSVSQHFDQIPRFFYLFLLCSITCFSEVCLLSFYHLSEAK